VRRIEKGPIEIMKIAAVRESDGKIFGILEQDQFRPLTCGGAPVRDLRQIIAGTGKLAQGSPRPLNGLKLAAPVGPLAKNVICVGKNYYDHAQEFARSGVDQSGDKQEIPEQPVVFTKATSSLADPFQEISASSDPTHSVDYEGELGVVIGRTARNVRRADALAYVFGYTIVNDVTARDLQTRHSQWLVAKSQDTFCPMGPWAVTRDEIDIADTAIRCFVNGDIRQSSNTRLLIFDIPTILATISAGVSLRAGDIVATGTPAGVGVGFDPPRYLKAGDVVRIEIDGIGVLENRVREATA
jgi:2-keto-4-pentenoate hydratase/2-oxohepta-3-ene-1,7-dioic acid hydratase in catechol pathway